ncbi:DUF485 domain-containing protein [Ornithinibacillus bavariensis]|uniref:DUF485 domain-containing protein n=1 Tax=Ornithinibacillus bavariensis TaxID=545502 RepID=A0A920C4D0_9BACI|nr:DUF485 domain-containing protein [Ornithinibacillus bavariensis]GIO25495.1 hypothetical protein J43TS3_01060 [Ornithinibacillus bavariensis]HAM80599.1 DUF485 domain-containing protein [Ornithinibacillus sp.]
MDERVLELIRRKKRLLIPNLAIIFLFYFMLPLSLIFYPDFMNKKSFVTGVTWAWLYAFLQLPFVWFMVWLYHVKAKQFDRRMEETIQEELP